MIVVIVRNPLDPKSWRRVETDDPLATIRDAFPTWPAQARIYDLDGIGEIDRAAALLDAKGGLSGRDVTPLDEAGVKRLQRAKGPLMVTVPPADPLTAVIAVAAVLLAVAVTLLLIPKIPTPDNTQSSNKSLSDRSNKARPNDRIPDIYGTVRSVPDLLAVPYRRFENNLELEISYMCVGRGSYDIADVRDGDTLLSSVAGASAAFYGPDTSPNTGDAPQVLIGSPIAYPVLTIISVGNVNGQLLRAPNANSVSGDDSIRFVYPDLIETNDSNIDFTKYFDDADILTVGSADFGDSGSVGTTTIQVSSRFEDGGVIRFESYDPRTTFAVGDNLTISNAGWAESDGISSTIYVDLGGTYTISALDATTITLSDPSDVNTDWDKLDELDGDHTGYRSSQFSIPTPTTAINLNGTYTVLSVNTNSITLSNPAAVNTAWNNLNGLDDNATDYGSPTLSTSGDRWIGPFIVDLSDLDRVITNFVALSGLYKVSKKSSKQHAVSVVVQLELTPVDINDNATGPAQTFNATLTGSADNKDQVGVTLDTAGAQTFTGRCSMRAKRVSATDLDYSGTLVDDVKWRDVVGGAPVGNIAFGNVTTVMTKTYATSGATSVKERKFNLRARRRVPRRISGNTFGDPIGSDDMADIISAVALDPFIGNRTVEEVDFDNLYSTSDAISAYFGSDLARQFAYTFDDDSVSFEETVATIAQACFCQGYRLGRLLKIVFEQATEDSSLLFNERNIVPGEQTRTVRFGVLDDHDGVEMDYTDPSDGAKLTITLPPNMTPTSPITTDTPGIGSEMLCYWQAWRTWNRARFQSIAVDLQATQEAALLLPQDRVHIVDITRPNYLSGEIIGQDGLTLTLSDPVDLDPDLDYQIFLQLPDATLQSIACSPTDDPTKVTIGAATRIALSTDLLNFTRATFEIAEISNAQTRAFLVSEREQADQFTESIKAVNYSFLYYQNDQLLLWLAWFGGDLTDQSAWERTLVIIGSGSIVTDPRWGWAYLGGGAGSSMTTGPNFLFPASYTKSAWVKGAVGSIIGSAHEDFRMDNGMLIVSHGAAHISASVDQVDYHHVAATFNNVTGIASLFVDGSLVETGTIADRTLDQPVAFNAFFGRAVDVRLYPRALSASEIREIYIGSVGGL